MRVEILLGSPRPNGNTAFLAGLLERHLEAAGAETGRHSLYDLAIQPCRDCRACKAGDRVCILDDDAKSVTDRLEGSDAFVLATPIYWYAPTAPAKLLIDRLRPFYGSRRLSGKRAAVLLAAGSGASDCDLTVEMLRRTFEALGVAFVGTVVSRSYDTGDAARDADAQARLAPLAGRLAAG